jgi:hypothetical protein
MIPQRSLFKNGSSIGVKTRVEACRKRLRVLRAIHKAQIDLQMPGEDEFSGRDGLEDPAVSSAVSLEESALVLPSLEGVDAQLT